MNKKYLFIVLVVIGVFFSAARSHAATFNLLQANQGVLGSGCVTVSTTISREGSSSFYIADIIQSITGGVYASGTITDNHGDAWIWTTHSPYGPVQTNSDQFVAGAAYLSAPSSGTTTVTWTASGVTGSSFCAISVYEFSYPATTTFFYDKDALQTYPSQSLTTSPETAPTITPLNAGELLFQEAVTDLGTGGYSAPWVTVASTTDAYILNSSSSATNADFTDDTTPDSGSSLIAAFGAVIPAPLLVAWVSPSSGAAVSSTVTLIASSTDNVPIQSVAFYEGGYGASFASSTFVGSSTVASGTLYSVSWNPRSFANGSTTLWALATNALNTTSTASTTVNVENPTDMGYKYYRAITVTSTASVASGTNANFPMLISSTVPSWEASSTGGRIQNLCTAPNGGTEPCDLVFATSSANCGLTPLNFETESYNSSTGALVDWVNVPSESAGTVIYVCYDDSFIANDKSHPSSTWNSNYEAVYHFPNGTILNASDSTSNANNPLLVNASPGAGYIDGGLSLNGSGQYIYVNDNIGLSGNWSLTGWIKTPSSLSGDNLAVFGRENGNPDYDQNYMMLYDGGNNPQDFSCGSSADSYMRVNAITSIATSTWYYLACTFATSTFTYDAYADGVLGGTTNGTMLTPGGAGQSVMIGTSNGSSTSFTYYGGAEDELRISDTTLPSSWILTEYNNQSSPNTFYTMGSEMAVPDTTPPSVSLTAPNSGATVSSVITLSASATDNVAVQGVQFQVDGTNLGLLITATSGPTTYSTTWDTTSASNGTHVISAIAYDTSNNTSTATASVTVDNVSNSNSSSPTVGGAVRGGFSSFTTVTITSPAANEGLSGTATLAATAIPVAQVAHVWFTIDGTAVGNQLTTAPFALPFDTSSLAPGTHTLVAYANDEHGDTAISSPVIFTVASGASGGATNSSSSSAASLQATIVALEAELQALQARAAAQGASPSSSYDFTRNLGWGSHGADVEQLQEFLIAQDKGPEAEKLASVGATGFFGLFTQNALSEYQRAVGISPPLGFFGPITRAMLNGE
jgi:hypothetical protein